jgi:hypothetical protein
MVQISNNINKLVDAGLSLAIADKTLEIIEPKLKKIGGKQNAKTKLF